MKKRFFDWFDDTYFDYNNKIVLVVINELIWSPFIHFLNRAAFRSKGKELVAAIRPGSTQFFSLCASVNTPSPFGTAWRWVWKRKVLTALDFQLIPHSFFSDKTEKQQRMKASSLFFCIQNSLCFNEDWTNVFLLCFNAMMTNVAWRKAC